MFNKIKKLKKVFFKPKSTEEKTLSKDEESGSVFKAIVFNDNATMEEIKKTCKKGHEKLTFNYSTFYLCHNCKDNSSCKSMSKEKLEEFKLFALYVVDFKKDRAYFAKDDSVILITNYKGTVTIEERVLDEDNADDEAESYFGMKSKEAITESLSELKKLTKEDNNKEKLMFLGILFMICGFIYYNFFMEEIKVIKTPPPMPPIIPLTELEKAHLHRALSKDLIQIIQKKVNHYEEHPELYELRRNIQFSLSYIRDIPPVTPVLVDEERWVYPPGPRRGASEYTISNTTEQIFPGVGYTHTFEDLYSKEHSVTLMYDEKYLDTNQSDLGKLVLSEKCLWDTLNLKGSLQPYKREDRSIEIMVKDVNASEIIEEVIPLVENCPIIIKEANQEQEKFIFKLVLYKIDGKDRKEEDAI